MVSLAHLYDLSLIPRLVVTKKIITEQEARELFKMYVAAFLVGTND